MKNEKATWIPAIDEPVENVTKYGWLSITENEGDFRETQKIWEITKWHSFDDFGATMETLTIEKDGETKEIYSYDEGETFTFDAY